MKLSSSMRSLMRADTSFFKFFMPLWQVPFNESCQPTKYCRYAALSQCRSELLVPSTQALKVGEQGLLTLVLQDYLPFIFSLPNNVRTGTKYKKKWEHQWSPSVDILFSSIWAQPLRQESGEQSHFLSTKFEFTNILVQLPHSYGKRWQQSESISRAEGITSKELSINMLNLHRARLRWVLLMVQH
jgi:hypothetical protein